MILGINEGKYLAHIQTTIFLLHMYIFLVHKSQRIQDVEIIEGKWITHGRARSMKIIYFITINFYEVYIYIYIYLYNDTQKRST